MTKSRQVQASEKYLQSPNAIHLSIISMKNSTAKTILTILSMNMSSSLSWRLMSSKHKERLDAKMRSRMVHSKKGLSTTSWTNCRMAVQVRPRHVLPKNEQQEQLKWSIDKLGTHCKSINKFLFIYKKSNSSMYFFYCGRLKVS